MAVQDYPSEEQIRARAYEIYLQRGSRPNREMDDWLQAEYELMQLPIRKLAEMHPPEQKKTGVRRPALVSLIQTALLFGTEALPHLHH